MRYYLTGNFQYDLGVYGLKKILDFFGEPYQSDDFYIEIDKKPEEILELIILRLVSQKSGNYFLEKVASTLFKDDNKKVEKIFKEKTVSFIDLNLEEVVKNKKNLKDVIKNLSLPIYKFLSENLTEKSFSQKDIEDILWNKAVNLLNNILLNFQADMNVRGEDTLQKAINKLYKDIEDKTCSFCQQHKGKRITRDTFFFAPAQFNAFWFGEPSIFICPYCLVSNLAITQSFTFLGNELNAVVIYRTNLNDLENLNEGLKISDIGEITKRIIDYEKLKLKKDGSIKELQILEFYLDSQNPKLDFYFLTEKTIKNLIKLENELEKLYTNYKNSLFGYVKSKKGYEVVNLSKEILNAIANNQKLIILVQKFLKFALMSENFRQKNVKNPPVKGFYIDVLLYILKMHFILEEALGMDMYDSFKEYGQFLRGRVYSSLSEDGDINWNTFNNKIISLANSFLDASKGTFDQFMETLTRVMISYDAPIDSNLLSMIRKDSYKDIATTIALSVMTRKPEEKVEKENEKTVKENSL
ncbi:hypothetical protein JCM14244_07810 [Venenivibrio stagnispumantis]|uniref:CRISPR-associated protein Cst1 n=1 Tax=Venenivibrio stagnispumantis TaxID=407998 RepID=A0AA46AFE4_9AQUI|nr:hypothetical protein [Venenivibrio stagnispumantis]MCW4573820.1 hypothetical protein [Venenivibrio stagnispumantis]SMP18980.1 CRISPR-associated protein Cst1 [Venenivibrio stagnispumantis]